MPRKSKSSSAKKAGKTGFKLPKASKPSTVRKKIGGRTGSGAIRR